MRHFVFLLLLFVGHCAVAQFGNEWINYGDNYLKISVNEEKIYQLDQTALKVVEPSIDQVDPRQFKLYHLGKQVPIWVEGESDGTFDPSDFIRFHGKANDGTTDRVLYRTPGEQPHSYSSLYTDSAAYFLTWNDRETSLRYVLNTNQNTSGLKTDPFFLHTVAKWFNNAWYDGSSFSDYAGYSQYTEGEGWMSSDVRGGYMSVSVPTPGFVASSGVPIQLDLLGFGKSNPSTPGDFDAQGNNHELSVYYNSESNLLASKRGKGYCTHRISTTIPPGLFSATSKLLFSSTFGARQRQAISWFTITYPRSFSDITDKVLHIYPNSSNQRIDLPNYKGSTQRPIIWDLNRREIIRPVKNGSTISFRFNSNGSNDLLIADSASIIRKPAIAQVKRIIFKRIDLANSPNFLIITHKSLRSGAVNYADYRSSADGGNFNVAMAYSDELYDQFYFGLHHPMALKNFVRYAWEESGRSLEYLFLLGKGQSYHLITYNATRRAGLDLVPTMGYPASDYFFSAGIGTASDMPGLATGRLPAKTNSEVELYLSKIKLHEMGRNDPALWRKKVIQISGGTSAAQNNQFKGYLASYGSVIRSDSFGGFTKLFSKDQNVVIQDNLTSQIIREVNDGSSMVSYFGHGSSDVLEVDMGFANQYDNNGRYPLFYFNGCVLGNSFDFSSLGEKFLLEPNGGCVNWLASTYYSFTGMLFDYGVLFHRNFFRNYYGAPLGKSLIKSLHEYYDAGDELKVSMCLQFICQGDPAARYFSPSDPDHVFDPSRTRLNPPVFAANADSFNIDVVVRNIGKTFRDTLVVELKRTNTAGYSQILRRSIPVSEFEHKFGWKLANTDTFKGVNYLQFTIDPDNRIAEQSPTGELNNSFSTEIFIPDENIYLYAPRENEIVSMASVELVVRSGLVSGISQTIEFELDTVPEMSSPALTRTEANGIREIRTTMNLLGIDSVDYYWRARIKGSKNAWITGNFAAIRGSGPGASQGRSDLVGKGVMSNMYIDSLGNYRFSSTTSQQYFIQTSGKFGSGSLARRGIRIDGYVARMLWFVNPGVQCLAINPRDESRYLYTSQFNMTSPRDPLGFGYPTKVNDPYYIQGNPTGVFEYNTTTKGGRDSLIQHLKRIPDDYFLFMYNGTETGIAQWEDSLFRELERFGFDELRGTLKETHPFALKGQKSNPKDAIQIFADTNNTVVTPAFQNIALSTNLPIPHSKGNLSTQWIGPALEWGQAHYKIRTENRGDDRYQLEILGRQADNKEVILAQTDSSHIDISHLSADSFPEMRMRITFTDSVHRTVAQLGRWIANYKPAPDIELIQDLSGLNSDTFKQGEKMYLRMTLQNNGKDTFGSSSIQVRYTLEDNTIVRDSMIPVGPIAPGSQRIVIDTLSTETISGNGQVLVNFNSNRKPVEPNYQNNSAIYSFHVRKFRLNALADIRVDGRTIMDRELVSSDPEINILVSQLDSFVFYNDLSLYELRMRYPGEDSMRIIATSDKGIEFRPVNKYGDMHSLIYRPGSLPTGTYEIQARIHNPVQLEKWDEVSARFKVIREQMVTNVFFYPNPFTTQAQIVYTLTGDVPPDQFRIDIYTVSGRKVKSIDLHEVEALQIGTHLSDFRWDGTDDFGDRLANGVYLYKTIVRSAGKELIRMDQSNDDLFQGGFGKLYLMR